MADADAYGKMRIKKCGYKKMRIVRIIKPK